ncbi:Retroelement pol Polyprotein [Phytophthora palmivora]|uniref:Retroelement pol Polyprotein n=1 Tax=Phytophthora palmivora TaxID=4796 RepID=A0A2P4XN88_9STRA|nr:Retroelement pol Polyprotein [Phytophthora palmivora]
MVSASDFETKVKDQAYLEVYHVHVKTAPQTKAVPLLLQPVLEEFSDVFPATLPPELPPTRSIEHEVVLKPGAQPSNRVPFRLCKVEQDTLEINIFGVPKNDPVTGKFPSRLEWLHSNDPNMPIRWVIDYRLVNAASKVAKIPLPHIEELFDRMEGACVFSILDLASGCHQMRMASSSKQYTAFRINHVIYEWNVAPMVPAGMPGTWTQLMRHLLHKFAFVVVYLDDICIFSQTMAEHAEHLRQVCAVLSENKLYARPDKGDFGQDSVDFLGHTISLQGLHVDVRKTRAIAE